MGQIAEKERLVKDIVSLRAVEGDLPAATERIAPVRANLERTIGRTVTRAMAARLLGVSQTALDRWVETGDVPVVMTRSGRQEIPLHALVDLIARVDQLRRVGDLHPLASALNAERQHAEELDLGRILQRSRRNRDRGGHGRAELLSLAYHRAIAERLHDQIVQEARRRLQQWRFEQRIAPRYATRWEELLSHSNSRIANLISQDDEQSADLRQNSPFAGLLSEPIRRRIVEAVIEEES